MSFLTKRGQKSPVTSAVGPGFEAVRRRLIGTGGCRVRTRKHLPDPEWLGSWKEGDVSGITCPQCGLFSPDSAERCDCGYDFRTRQNPTLQNQDTRRANPVAVLVGLAVLVGVVWYYLGGGLQHQAARNLQ